MKYKSIEEIDCLKYVNLTNVKNLPEFFGEIFTFMLYKMDNIYNDYKLCSKDSKEFNIGDLIYGVPYYCSPRKTFINKNPSKSRIKEFELIENHYGNPDLKCSFIFKKEVAKYKKLGSNRDFDTFSTYTKCSDLLYLKEEDKELAEEIESINKKLMSLTEKETIEEIKETVLEVLNSMYVFKTKYNVETKYEINVEEVKDKDSDKLLKEIHKVFPKSEYNSEYSEISIVSEDTNWVDFISNIKRVISDLEYKDFNYSSCYKGKILDSDFDITMNYVMDDN